MLSIHNNLSLDAQNIIAKHLINYACLQALVNNVLTLQSSCVMVNNGTKSTPVHHRVASVIMLVNNVLAWQSSCVIANNGMKNSKTYVHLHGKCCSCLFL